MYTVLLLTVLLTTTFAKEDLSYKYLTKVYDECQKSDAILPCLKKKAILFFDRAARMETIPLLDGVDVVKVSKTDENVPISENEIDAALPRNLQDKNEALTQMLWDKVASFANSRTIQLALPKMTGAELNRGVEEGKFYLLQSVTLV